MCSNSKALLKWQLASPKINVSLSALASCVSSTKTNYLVIVEKCFVLHWLDALTNLPDLSRSSAHFFYIRFLSFSWFTCYANILVGQEVLWDCASVVGTDGCWGRKRMRKFWGATVLRIETECLVLKDFVPQSLSGSVFLLRFPPLLFTHWWCFGFFHKSWKEEIILHFFQ